SSPLFPYCYLHNLVLHSFPTRRSSDLIILGVHPFLFLAVILTFLISLYLSKYVSLASMVTGVVATIITMFMNQLLLFLMILALTIFVFIRHKDNIKRIKNK